MKRSSFAFFMMFSFAVVSSYEHQSFALFGGVQEKLSKAKDSTWGKLKRSIQKRVASVRKTSAMNSAERHKKLANYADKKCDGGADTDAACTSQKIHTLKSAEAVARAERHEKTIAAVQKKGEEKAERYGRTKKNNDSPKSDSSPESQGYVQLSDGPSDHQE